MYPDRTFSFSVKPDDKVALQEVQKLKQYCKENYISFSSLVVKGIKHVNQELNLQ